MGQRIRQIRLAQGLRQWELARLLGTSQSAVHKYEHGVTPEPRRLIELARIGRTSVEWVLTGQHWENGSPEQQRLSPDLSSFACRLHEFGHEEREVLHEALRLCREAVRLLRNPDPSSPPLPPAAEDTVRLLEAAEHLQRAVLHQIDVNAEKRRERVAYESSVGDDDPSTPR